jgi:Amt family ammonium transporter
MQVKRNKRWKLKNRRQSTYWGAYNSNSRANSRSQNIWQRIGNGIKGLTPTWQACIPLAALIVLFSGYAAVAQTPKAVSKEDFDNLKVAVDTVWVMIAAFLVIFMNAGFAMLETGFCRQKNAVNILSKNLIVFALATIAYWAIGFGLMFGNGNGYFGLSGFFLQGDSSTFKALEWTSVPLAAKFLFQVAFAGTAATIVSGAVAERIKFIDFLIFSLALVGISYAVTGHWIWGGGWLAQGDEHFWDFAGCTVVHSVGGWSALTGVLFLGARAGKYQNGEITALPGHNMSIATLGCLILWLGWFGFNPGSTMAADPSAIAHIALTTNLSAAAGGITATITAWVYLGKPDLSMIINGILAGLVGITASCAYVNYGSSVMIGAIAGVIVVFSVTLFEKQSIDDPVGATSVHLVCGIWGTLAVGLFSVGPDVYSWYGKGLGPAKGLLLGGGINQLWLQIVGVVAVGVFTVAFSSLVWAILKSTLGMRVSLQEELEGLDIGEHGMEAYSGFLKEASPGGFMESGRADDMSSGAGDVPTI